MNLKHFTSQHALSPGRVYDVITTINASAGKNFLLHCYIVTSGAGAERGKSVFSLENLQQSDTKRNKPMRVFFFSPVLFYLKSEKTAKWAQPTEPGPGEETERGVKKKRKEKRKK